MMPTGNYMILFLFLLLGFFLFLYLLLFFRNSAKKSYRAASVDESIKMFQSDIEPFLMQLQHSKDCSESAVVVNKLKNQYMQMLKIVKQYPKNSPEREKIFNQALQPVLDKLSYANSRRECFKDPGFQKAFDRFIRLAQRYADN